MSFRIQALTGLLCVGHDVPHISDDPNKHKSTGAGSQMLSGLFQVWWGCRRQSYMLTGVQRTAQILNIVRERCGSVPVQSLKPAEQRCVSSI